jgi:hypothetical protein
MDNFKNLFQKDNLGELSLTILFIIYLIMGYKLPHEVSNRISTPIGKIAVILIALSLFIYCNPILGIISLFVAFDLIRRSDVYTGIDALKKYAPTEEKKSSQFTAFNQFPYTLEQEVVNRMAPIVRTESTLFAASYKPMLENLHDATPLTSTF